MDRNYYIEGCFMDDNKQFVFIHIYKNASISLRNALGIRGKYYRYEDVKKYNPITICIIRNPIDRVISSFLYIFRLEDNGLPDQHPIEETKKMDFFNIPDIKESFKLFLKHLENGNFFDAVTLPQTEFLSDRGLTINDIDEILLQDNLQQDYNILKNKYNLKNNINIDNYSDTNNKAIIKKFIENNIDVQDTIKSIYFDDFKLYNSLVK